MEDSFQYPDWPSGIPSYAVVCQAFINDVLREMLNHFVFVYLDDIFIFSYSLQEHIDHFQQVLKELLKARKMRVPCFPSFILCLSRRHPDGTKEGICHYHLAPAQNTEADTEMYCFANFYSRFIHNFNTIAASISAITKGSPTHIQWAAEALESFDRLKELISSAPILLHLDPQLHFIVEGDTSEVGVGGVLSQRSILDNKVNPCSFFSRSLSSAERSNRVKLTLEESCHWLEGSKHPFIMWTDHNNLSYL